MTDTIDGLIAEIHEELDSLLSPVVIPYSVDDRAVAMHGAPPRIVWVDADSTVTSAIIIGGNDGTIGTDVAHLEAHIWQTDREQARLTMHALILAAYHVCYGPNLSVPGYRWAEAAYAKHGRVIIATIELSIPIPDEAMPVAAVAATTHEVTVDGETVCE